MKLAFILALATIGLSSCTSWEERAERRRIDKIEKLSEEARQRDANPNQHNYKVGMNDGCNSGRNATGAWGSAFTKNADLYVGNQYYKTGWDDGFAKCKTEGENINNVIRDSVR